MRKLSIVVVALLVALTGCGNDQRHNEQNRPATSQQAPTTASPLPSSTTTAKHGVP